MPMYTFGTSSPLRPHRRFFIIEKIGDKELIYLSNCFRTYDQAIQYINQSVWLKTLNLRIQAFNLDCLGNILVQDLEDNNLEYTGPIHLVGYKTPVVERRNLDHWKRLWRTYEV